MLNNLINEENYVLLGNRLKQLRKSHGFTQEDVADAIGINKKTYGKYENGSNALPAYALEKLSQLYGMTVDCIINDRKLKADEKISFLLAGHSEASKEHVYNLVKFVMKEFKL